MRRRDVLAAAALAAVGTARAAPDRDVSFVIPYASGGGFDAYVRTVIPALQKQLGTRVLPDNVDGAGGARAANLLFRAKPDGATISVVNIPGALILQLQGGLGFDLGQLTWLCNMGRDAYGLMVPADSALRSIDDLRALGRTRRVKFTCIGPAGTAYSAIRGDGDAAVASLTSLTQFRASGLIRVLATFEASGSLPGVPDATALGAPELADLVQLRPVAGPPGLPAPLAQTLSDALVKALADPAVIAWARRNNANLHPDDAGETVRMMARQAGFVARWKDYLAT